MDAHHEPELGVAVLQPDGQQRQAAVPRTVATNSPVMSASGAAVTFFHDKKTAPANTGQQTAKAMRLDRLTVRA